MWGVVWPPRWGSPDRHPGPVSQTTLATRTRETTGHTEAGVVFPYAQGFVEARGLSAYPPLGHALGGCWSKCDPHEGTHTNRATDYPTFILSTHGASQSPTRPWPFDRATWLVHYPHMHIEHLHSTQSSPQHKRFLTTKYLIPIIFYTL